MDEWICKPSLFSPSINFLFFCQVFNSWLLLLYFLYCFVCKKQNRSLPKPLRPAENTRGKAPHCLLGHWRPKKCLLRYSILSPAPGTAAQLPALLAAKRRRGHTWGQTSPAPTEKLLWSGWFFTLTRRSECSRSNHLSTPTATLPRTTQHANQSAGMHTHAPDPDQLRYAPSLTTWLAPCAALRVFFSTTSNSLASSRNWSAPCSTNSLKRQ